MHVLVGTPTQSMHFSRDLVEKLYAWVSRPPFQLISIKAASDMRGEDYFSMVANRQRARSPAMEHTRTWILVADGGRARILETTAKHQAMHFISGSRSHLDGPPDREMSGAASDHSYGSAGLARFGVESRRASNTALEALFASQLASMLADHSAKEAFDRLIIIAPATMLGNLRKMIKPEVRNKVVAEIDEDPADIPNNEIASRIETVIGASR